MTAIADRPRAVQDGPVPDRLETLDMFLELLSEVDIDTDTCNFYTKVCEAIARLTRIKRVVLLLVDPELRVLRAAGATGITILPMHGIELSLDDIPLAERAMTEGAIVEADEDVDDQLGSGLAAEFGVRALVCVPLTSVDHCLGVILAELPASMTLAEREVLWTAGKVGALAASARSVTRDEERARRLREHIGVARAVHEQVIQRLFAVSCALAAETLGDGERTRCREEVASAVRELRDTLERPVAGTDLDPGPSLQQELKRLSSGPGGTALSIDWPASLPVPPRHESLVRHFVVEAVRNVHKHAPTGRIALTASQDGDAFEISVANDGVCKRPAGSAPFSGLGTTLLAADAAAAGASFTGGAEGSDRWRASLRVPLREAS